MKKIKNIIWSNETLKAPTLAEIQTTVDETLQDRGLIELLKRLEKN